MMVLDISKIAKQDVLRSYSTLNNNNLASIHKQKCLYGGCGIQHHMPRDSGKGSPTCALGNSHTDLSLNCRPYSGL